MGFGGSGRGGPGGGTPSCSLSRDDWEAEGALMVDSNDWPYAGTDEGYPVFMPELTADFCHVTGNNIPEGECVSVYDFSKKGEGCGKGKSRFFYDYCLPTLPSTFFAF